MSVIVVSHAQCQYSLQKWYMCISQRCRGHRAQLLHNQCRQICALYASVVDIQISFSELNFSRQAAIPLWCHRQNLTASSRCCTLPRMQKSCVEYFSQICVHVSRTMYADGDKVSWKQAPREDTQLSSGNPGERQFKTWKLLVWIEPLIILIPVKAVRSEMPPKSITQSLNSAVQVSATERVADDLPISIGLYTKIRTVRAKATITLLYDQS